MNVHKFRLAFPQSEQIFLICYTKQVAGRSRPGKLVLKDRGSLRSQSSGISDKEETQTWIKCCDERSRNYHNGRIWGCGEEGFLEEVFELRSKYTEDRFQV
jgi:hypothetical protein